MTSIRCSAAGTAVAGALALGMLTLGARAFGASNSASPTTREERHDLIAYGIGGGEDRHVIRTIRSDGTGDRRFIGPTRMRFFRGPSRPEWSRDGSKLLFGGHLHLDTEAQTLWYSNASGRRVTRVRLGLGEGLEGHKEPTLHGWDWAPGGRRVVVAAGPTWPFSPRLYTVSLDGRHRRALSEGSLPEWSGDGRYIVFAVHLEDAAFEPRSRIAVIRPNGRGFRTLTRGTRDAFPRFSPDGRRVLFVRRGGLRGMRWRVVDVTGRNNVAVGPRHPGKRPYCAPQWTPEGAGLAVVRLDQGSERGTLRPSLVTMKVSGADKRVVFRFPQRPDYYYSRAEAGICDFSWRPR